MGLVDMKIKPETEIYQQSLSAADKRQKMLRSEREGLICLPQFLFHHDDGIMAVAFLINCPTYFDEIGMGFGRVRCCLQDMKLLIKNPSSMGCIPSYTRHLTLCLYCVRPAPAACHDV